MDDYESKTTISRKRMMPNATIHHIPCEIEYTGSAPVTDYFVINDDNQVKESMFRGRLLQGEEFALPKDLEGNMNCIRFTNRSSSIERKRSR